LAVSVLLLFLPSVQRETLARGVRATVLWPILALQQGAVERQALIDDPRRLRAERDSLAAYLVGTSTLMTENRQLRELLGLRERLPPTFVPAEVVRIPGRGSEGFFQLTTGVEQGVMAGAPIVSGQGLVGRVREVDAAIAFGIDWMHPEFRASAMTLDGSVYGIVEPRRVGGQPLLVLTGTPSHVELESGALLVTSGHGGVFPRGIPIGTVVGVEGGEEGWQRNYLVQPLVAPPGMAYVLVLGGPQRSMEGRDLATAWGIQPTPVAPPPTAIPADADLVPASTSTPAPTPAQAPAQAPPARPAPQQGPPLLGVPVEPQ